MSGYEMLNIFVENLIANYKWKHLILEDYIADYA